MATNENLEMLKRLLNATAEFCELEERLARPITNVLDYAKNSKNDSQEETVKKESPRPLLFKTDLISAQDNSIQGTDGEIFRFRRVKKEPKPRLELPPQFEDWKKSAKGSALRDLNEGEEYPHEVQSAWNDFVIRQQKYKAALHLPEFYAALHALYHSRGTEKCVTLGIGMFRSKKLKANHPLIEIALEVAVDSKTNDILLLPTDMPPTFWSFAGTSLEDNGYFNQAVVDRLKSASEARLNDTEVSPFDASSYYDILCKAKDDLSSSMQNIDSHLDVDVRGPLPEETQIVDTWAIYKSKSCVQHAVKQDCQRMCAKLQVANFPSWASRFVQNPPAANDDHPLQITAAESCLFPLDCNKEQIEILEKLNTQSAVVVKGPPGTGKTHTVANMICHFLAQGQRVLVISEGPEALKVLWKKVTDAVNDLEKLAVLWPTLKDAVEQLRNTVPALIQLGKSGIAAAEVEKLGREERNKRVSERKISAIDDKFKFYANLRLLLLKDEVPDSAARDQIERDNQEQCTIRRSILVEIVSCLDEERLDYSPEEIIFQMTGSTKENNLAKARACFSPNGVGMGDARDGAARDCFVPSQKLLEGCREIHTRYRNDFEGASRVLKEKCGIISKFADSNDFQSNWRVLLLIRCVESYLLFLDTMIPLEDNLAKRREIERDLHRSCIRTIVGVKARGAIKPRFDTAPQLPTKLQELLTTLEYVASARKKNVGMHLERVKNLLQDQSLIQAFPLWVMTSSKVSDVLPSEVGSFDLVVLDEASQSGIGCLPALLRGKKILVIGDEKQVSPGDHASDFDEAAKKIQDKHLKGFPYNNLCCAVPMEGHSIFDLCITAFAQQTCVLREHFRCVREIIQFSSEQFYSGNLIAVRQQPKFHNTGKRLELRCVKEGKRENEKNQAEAAAIIKEVEKIIQRGEERDGDVPSIGIISLWGDKQAKLISDKLTSTETIAKNYDKYKIKCGDAFDFQGDERDIVLTSMVVDDKCRPVPDTGLRLKRNEQNYNVAASRARDCMYLFYSSLPKQGKTSDDVRQKYYKHFTAKSQDEQAFDSWERSSLKSLSDRLKAMHYVVRFMSQRQGSDEMLAILVVEDGQKQVGFVPMGARAGVVRGIRCWEDNYSFSLILTRADWKLYFIWMSQIESSLVESLDNIVAILKLHEIKPSAAKIPEQAKSHEERDSKKVTISRYEQTETLPGLSVKVHKRRHSSGEKASQLLTKVLGKCFGVNFIDDLKGKHECFNSITKTFGGKRKTKDELLSEIVSCKPDGVSSVQELAGWIIDQFCSKSRDLSKATLVKAAKESGINNVSQNDNFAQIAEKIRKAMDLEENVVAGEAVPSGAGEKFHELNEKGERDNAIEDQVPAIRNEIQEPAELLPEEEIESHRSGIQTTNLAAESADEGNPPDASFASEARKAVSKKGIPAREIVTEKHRQEFTSKHLAAVLNDCFDGKELKEVVKACLAKDAVAFRPLQNKLGQTKEVQLSLLSQCRSQELSCASDLLLWLVDNRILKRSSMTRFIDLFKGDSAKATANRIITQYRPPDAELNKKRVTKNESSRIDEVVQSVDNMIGSVTGAQKVIHFSDPDAAIGTCAAAASTTAISADTGGWEEPVRASPNLRPKADYSDDEPWTDKVGSSAPVDGSYNSAIAMDTVEWEGTGVGGDTESEADSVEEASAGGGSSAAAGGAAPKKATPYILFSKDNRDKVLADNPGISFQDTGKVLGVMWKALDPEQKAVYERQAAAHMARKAAYDAEHPGAAAEGKKRKRGAKDKGGKGKKARGDGAPKKASAYILFCNEQRSAVQTDNPGISFADVGKMLGARWAALGEEGKKVYLEREKALKEQGRQDLATPHDDV